MDTTWLPQAITQWLATNQTSPVTRNPLTLDNLVPNLALKEMVEAAVAAEAAAAAAAAAAGAMNTMKCPITKELMTATGVLTSARPVDG